jgi:hypothetical protein
MNLQPPATALAATLSGAAAMIAVAPVPDIGFILQAVGLGALVGTAIGSSSSGASAAEVCRPTPTCAGRSSRAGRSCSPPSRSSSIWRPVFSGAAAGRLRSP